MTEQRAWLIDASIYIFRAWFSYPDRWHSPEGYSLNAVYGYTRFLLDFLASTGGSSHCAVAFDESLGSNFRNDIYPDYKCSRVLPDEDLAFQLNCCREITECLGFPCFGGERYEADDYIAALAKRFQRRGIPVTVVTRDKDLGQILVNEQDSWWDFAQNENLSPDAFAQRFGVRPEQFADYLALVGDPIDDVPGVPGVGAKTAAALLSEFGGLGVLEKNLDRVQELNIRGAKGLADKLRDNWSQISLSRQLTGLAHDIPGLARVNRFKLRAINVSTATAYLEELQLGAALISRCEAVARGLSA